jgi:hypothetical protein
MLSRLRPSTACRRSPPGTARHWRRRRFVAGFTNREDEGPTELPMVERFQHGPRQRQPRIACTPRACPRHGNPDRQPVRCLASPWPTCRRSPPGAVVASWPASPIERTKARPNCRWSSAASTGHASGNRGLPAPREPDQATERPIGSRCAVPRSTWHHLPAIATRRRRRFVAGFTNREDEGPTELPAIEHCKHPEILPTPRQPRSAAGTLSRLRPGPLAGDRHQAPLDTGAVVASWPASPIERTKARPNCR